MLSKIKNNIKQNIKDYLSLSLFFIGGIVFGIFIVNKLSNIQKEELINNVNTFISGLKNNNSINYAKLFGYSIKSNLISFVVITIVSLSLFGRIGSSAFILYNGIKTGYTLSAFILANGKINGMLQGSALIFINKIIYIPLLFFLIISSFKFYECIKEEKYDNKKVLIFQYFAIQISVVVGLLICSAFETFICSNLFLYIIHLQ